MKPGRPKPASPARRKPMGPPSRPKGMAPRAGLDRKRLAAIHIVKKELGMSDEDYRCILKRIARVESSRDLDERRFRKLMYFLVHSHYYRANAFGMTLRQKMFIDTLVRQLAWDPNHLRNFVRKYYHRDGLEALNGREASHLIESLKAILGQRPRPG